jgi:hypothetical protein
MTEKELDILDQLIETGRVKRTVLMFDGKGEATFATMTTQDHLEAESEIRGTEGTVMYITHLQSIKFLCRGLKEFIYKGKPHKFADFKEAGEFINASSTLLVDALVDEFSKFQREVAKISSNEEVQKNFTETPEIDTGSLS